MFTFSLVHYLIVISAMVLISISILFPPRFK